MIQTGTGDLDFANALLHARRSRMHEGFRLNETCRLRTISELAYTLASIRGAISFSRLQRLILAQCAALLPYSGLRDIARTALSGKHGQLFLLEAALDCEYFREMLVRAGGIPSTDLAGFKSLILQEIDIFHLLPVVRGKFIHGFNTEQLLALHISGTGSPSPYLRNCFPNRNLSPWQSGLPAV